MKTVCLVALGMIANGCNCNPAPVECNDIALSFRSPAAGDTVLNPFAAEVEARDSSGALVPFDSAKLTIGTTVIEGAVGNSRATFANISLPSGPATLEAKILRGVCERTASLNVVVGSSTGTAKISKLEFPQDLNLDAALNNVELPLANALQIKVTSTNTNGVQLRVKHNQDVSTLVSFVNGSAVASIANAPAQDAAYVVDAELVKESDGSVVDSFSTNMAARGTIALNRQAPNCVNTTSTAPQGPRTDIDAQTAGHQFRAQFQIPADVNATVEFVGAGNLVTLAGSGMVTSDITAPAMGDTTRELRLVCRDSSGNSTTSSVQVRIDYQAPSVVIASPSSPDGGRLVITASPVAVQVATMGAEDMSVAQLFRVQGATRVSQGMGNIAMNAVSLSAPFAVDGLYNIEVDVTDSAGNVGTGRLPVDVQLVGCGAVFTQPGTCPAFVVTTTSPFAIQSQTRCAGQAAKLFRVVGATATQLGASGVVAANGSTSFGNIALADGNHSIRADVTNPSGSISSVTCAVTVSTTRPVILNPVKPAVGNNPINQTEDTNTTLAGAQKLLGFSAVVPMGGRVDLCADGVGAPVAGAACPGGPVGYKVLQANVTSGSVVTFPEGIYNVKIVVVSGAIAQDSDFVPVEVDVTAPCVAATGVTLPQDTAPAGDNRLNIAEVGVNAPRVAFTVNSACGSAISAQVRGVTGTTINATAYTAIAPNPMGAVTLDLTQNVAVSGSLDVFVELKDAIGNTNVFAGVAMNATARKAFSLDRTAPTCTLTQPSKVGTLNLADVTAVGANFRLSPVATTDADVSNVIFQLAAAMQTSPVAAGSSTVNFDTLTGTQTGVSLTAQCVDAAGNSTTATKTLDWDLQAPTCAFTAPVANSTANVNSVVTSLTVGGAEGRTVTIKSGATDLGSLNVTAGVATGPITYANGANQMVTGTVSDVAGNTCVANVQFSVMSTSCDLTLTNVYTNGSTFWKNASHVAAGTITASSTGCPTGNVVTLTRLVPPAAPVTQTMSGGTVSFTQALADGEQYEVSIAAGVVLTTRTVTVDLVAPTAGAVTLNSAVPPAIPFFLVAATGNSRVASMTAGYIADGDGATAGGQMNVNVANIVASLGGSNGKAEFVFKGTALPAFTTAISTNPQTVSLPTFTLPQADTGAFVVRVTDQAGNIADLYTQTVTIDVVAPAAPVVTRTLMSARQGTVQVTWPAVVDATQYDLRWTTSSVFQNNAMATEADYFGASSSKEADIAQAVGMMTKALTLPPINSYYIGLRARDDVYNYSTYAAPTVLDNKWTQITLTGPVNTTFGESVQVANLNSDATKDLIVGATTISIPGAVHIYWGGSTFGSQSGCIVPACQTINAPVSSGPTGSFFGFDISVAGNVGDETTENKSDLVVSQPTFPVNAGPGRVIIYFGSATASIVDTNFIEIRGDASNAIGQVSKIIRSIDGDGLDELAIAVPGYNMNRGRVYIFKGRTASAWRAKRTSTDGTTLATYISIVDADWVIEGPSTALVAQPYFGRNRYGLSSLGDLNLPADGKIDFAIPMGPSSVNRFQVWNGATVSASIGPIANTSAQQEISQTAIPGSNTSQNGFGNTILGGFNLTNALANDLVVSWPVGASIFVYADVGPSVPMTPTLTLDGPSLFGTAVAISGIRTSTKTDLLIGSGVISGGATSGAYVGWAQAGGVYDNKFGNFVRFWQSKFDGNVITGATAHAFSTAVELGDINADTESLPEVIISDRVGGKVYLWTAQ